MVMVIVVVGKVVGVEVGNGDDSRRWQVVRIVAVAVVQCGASVDIIFSGGCGRYNRGLLIVLNSVKQCKIV